MSTTAMIRYRRPYLLILLVALCKETIQTTSAGTGTVMGATSTTSTATTTKPPTAWSVSNGSQVTTMQLTTNSRTDTAPSKEANVPGSRAKLTRQPTSTATRAANYSPSTSTHYYTSTSTRQYTSTSTPTLSTTSNSAQIETTPILGQPSTTSTLQPSTVTSLPDVPNTSVTSVTTPTKSDIITTQRSTKSDMITTQRSTKSYIITTQRSTKSYIITTQRSTNNVGPAETAHLIITAVCFSVVITCLLIVIGILVWRGNKKLSSSCFKYRIPDTENAVPEYPLGNCSESKPKPHNNIDNSPTPSVRYTNPFTDKCESNYVNGESDYVNGETDYINGESDYVNGESVYVIGESEHVIGESEYIIGESEYVNGDTVYENSGAHMTRIDERNNYGTSDKHEIRLDTREIDYISMSCTTYNNKRV